ncbi:MAG TPA: hypothetical protein VK773_01300 [Acidimicrobiales bacterium]|jgi:hypothetical protein|nr:hypothetical protein [Acidimicrobiales bacterium]
MPRISFRSVGVVCASGLGALAVAVVPAVTPAGGDQPTPQPSLTALTILSGMTLSHTYTVSGTTNSTASEPLTKPDDITKLGGLLFVGFQNGVGPQGEPSSDGNTDSTIVALDRFGQALAQWDVQGKVDGLTADRAIGGLIATVNEDANSSLYTITPGAHGAADVQHYTYNEPLPHNGGTDAISILRDQILISASAPGTIGTTPAPNASFPAVYSVTLDPSTSVATVSPLFYDEDTATVANVGPQEGQTTALALTDPDSSEIVPNGAPRFAHDFMLDSQGDQQQIFVGKGERSKSLSVLSLSQSVDDTAWAIRPGVLYGTDSTNDAVVALRGTFGSNPIVAVTPCGANSAPTTCPSLPANYLGSLDPWTGAITPVPVSGADFVPQGGLVFVPFRHQR